MNNTSVSSPVPTVGFTLDSRNRFLVSTYVHFLLVVLGFVSIETILFQNGIAAILAQFTSGEHWLRLVAPFLLVAGVGWLAARQVRSTLTQYLALFILLFAQVILCIPILYLAESAAVGFIASITTIAMFGFASLACIALGMRHDFSLAHALPIWGVTAAFLLVVARSFFGLAPGVSLAVAAIAIVGTLILCHTAFVLQNYPTDRPVAAALELFAICALPFGAFYYL